MVEAYLAHTGIAHVQLARGDFEAALESARRSLPLNPSFDPTYWMLVAGNAHLGRMEAAQMALADYLAIVPEMTLARLKAGQRTKDPQRTEVLLTGLRLAGMPES